MFLRAGSVLLLAGAIIVGKCFWLPRGLDDFYFLGGDDRASALSAADQATKRKGMSFWPWPAFAPKKDLHSIKLFQRNHWIVLALVLSNFGMNDPSIKRIGKHSVDRTACHRLTTS